MAKNQEDKWQEVKLGDCLLNANTGLDALKRAPIINQETGIKCLRIQDISQKKSFIEWGNTKVTNADFSKFSLKEGDIIIARTGSSIGINTFIKENLNAVYNNGLIRLKVNSSIADKKFVFMNLRSEIYKEFIIAISGGTSTQPNMQIKDLLSFSFFLPPLDVQKKIAGVLGALDDKIELNNKINQNLEAQAQALFKSWFIDFEPFGGKMPDDWKEINLSDIAEFIGGYSYKSSELQSSSTVMATIKNFDRQGGFKLDGFKEISPSEKLKENQKISLFDTLVAHTDLTQNADVIGNAEMLLSTAGYSNVIISMDVVKVIPKKGISKFLLATLLKDNRFKQHCLGYINGTTVLHLSKKALPEYTFAFPNNMTDVAKLTNILEYLYKKLAYNIEENLRLAELRDALLPKLMSGEINVDDVKISDNMLSSSEE